jgi:4-carboxymuconolactone decarboxylase
MIIVNESAKRYYEKTFGESADEFFSEDPDFAVLFGNFAFDEVVNEGETDQKIRLLAITSVLIGCGANGLIKKIIKADLILGITPEEIKEIIYQSVAYLGVGRTQPIFEIANDVFKQNGITLPTHRSSSVDFSNRLIKGVDKQVEIFGNSMKEFYKSGPEETSHINRWLADNCFGDYYTGKILNNNIREMITFCLLAAQGGCEAQLTAHAQANMRIGNSKSFLIGIISQCMPYIGYPRTLNAIKCINDATDKK